MVARVPCTECAVGIETSEQIVRQLILEKQSMGRTSLLESFVLKPRTIRSGSDIGFSDYIATATSQRLDIQDCLSSQPIGFDASNRSHRSQAIDSDAHRTIFFRDPMCFPYDPPPLTPNTAAGTLKEEVEAVRD